MGTLFYGATSEPIEVPDPLLAHVKVVATTKLRRGECFTLSWQHTDDQRPGRTTIWMQPSIPLRFVFDTTESEPLDRAVLHELVEGANSTRGLVIDLHAQIGDDVMDAASPLLQPA